MTSLPFNTTIPHSKLKDKLRELAQKNGQRRCKYLVLGRDRYYAVKHHSESTKKFSETDRIYPIELEIKDTTDTDRSASYLDLHLEIDSEGRLRTKLYDKRDDFNFPILNFPFICSNIPAAPAYEVYISELIRYSRLCGSY